MRALRETAPAGASVDAFGVGGPKLQAEGLRVVVDARELLAMGFSEILGRLPRIIRALREVEESARAEHPDVAVVIDYPDFHFRLAERLRRQTVPVIYFIPPKVWVWRKGRIAVLRERFSKVLSILPFEVEFYERERVPVTYVGNPLVDQLPLGMSREEARAILGIPTSDTVIVLMPGSRPSELMRHLDPMLEAAARTAQKLNRKLTVLVPFAVTSELEALQMRTRPWRENPLLDLRTSQGDSAVCMLAADAGLIKSGTSTLEAGMLLCPHAVVYRPSAVSAWIFRNIIRYRGPVGLVNLVAGYSADQPYLIREILCEEVTAESLSEELLSLLTNEARRRKISEGLQAMRRRVIGSGSETGQVMSPSRKAAREIWEFVGKGTHH